MNKKITIAIIGSHPIIDTIKEKLRNSGDVILVDSKTSADHVICFGVPLDHEILCATHDLLKGKNNLYAVIPPFNLPLGVHVLNFNDNDPKPFSPVLASRQFASPVNKFVMLLNQHCVFKTKKKKQTFFIWFKALKIPRPQIPLRFRFYHPKKIVN